LTNSRVWALAVSGTNLFAGTEENGVFLSTNSGTSWTAVGLANSLVHSLVVNGTTLFAGTSTDLWHRPLSEMITSVQEVAGDGLLKEFELKQDYPNPFNPSTIITFELPNSSMVRLSVYDILGREVSVLANERRNAGVHEVTFDGANLASVKGHLIPHHWGQMIPHLLVA
jgi:hypothetical protein